MIIAVTFGDGIITAAFLIAAISDIVIAPARHITISAAAIIIGNEGEGMSQLVRKNCDVMVHIPMKGKITSLNASAAASILLYEAVRQRLS